MSVGKIGVIRDLLLQLEEQSAADWEKIARLESENETLKKEKEYLVSQLRELDKTNNLTFNPPWQDAPEWAEWAAVDQDGHAYWFEKRPVAYYRDEEKGIWLIGMMHTVSAYSHFHGIPKGFQWDKSAVQRPKE